MENNECKTVCIKSLICYYLCDIIKLEDCDLDNILIDKNSHENSLIYDISCKTLIDPKPLRIRLNQIDEFIRIYDETRYFTLFSSEKYEVIYNKMTLRNVIIHVKSVLSKDKNHCYYKILLEKCSYQLTKK